MIYRTTKATRRHPPGDRHQRLRARRDGHVRRATTTNRIAGASSLLRLRLSPNERSDLSELPPGHDAPYQGQPYFCSEYGGIWWNPGQTGRPGLGLRRPPATEQQFLDRYRALTETLLFNPHMFAFCYTQLTDVEQEVNGLYTYDRKPKFDPEIIRKINTQRAAIETA